jgi:hypothetical protein
MTVDAGQFSADLEEEPVDTYPVKVHLIADDTTAPTRVAEYGSAVTYPVPVAPQYVQILQRNVNRQDAIIRNPLFTIAGQAQNITVIINSNVQAIQQGIGFVLDPGTNQLIANQQPWYAVAVTGPGSVSVLDERWEYE